MGKISCLLLLCFAVVGCATASQTYLPSGEQGHNITCSGTALNWGHCYEKAGEICGARGYDIVDKSGDQGATFAGNRFGLYGGSVIQRSMLIKCK